MCDACKAAGNEKGVPQVEVTPEIISAVASIINAYGDDLLMKDGEVADHRDAAVLVIECVEKQLCKSR